MCFTNVKLEKFLHIGIMLKYYGFLHLHCTKSLIMCNPVMRTILRLQHIIKWMD